MSISAKELLQGCNASFIGKDDVLVKDITYNSAGVCKDSAFFCIEGFSVDGHKFAPDAASRGAVLIVANRRVDVGSANVTIAIVEDTRKVMAMAAANFYGNPSEKFKLVGITGTNGKTTTSYITDHIIRCAGMKCGIIGTTGNRVGDVLEEAKNTTPESIDLQHLFSRMVNANCAAVVMEVSSHALDLQRPYASHFDVCAFTNLTQDHLDFHNTFEDYFNAKAKLFSDTYPARRVICIDDEWGARLACACKERGDSVITCGFSSEADISPVSLDYSSTKTHAVLCVKNKNEEKHIEIEYPLVGKFNVSNVMCAFGIALQLGISAGDIVCALKDLPKVPGRLEQFCERGCASVFVDYAHTPDAIEKAIASIRDLKPAKIICVFGCGGDRDAKKRPLMGKAALAADFAIVTSDNPRTEDPLAIIKDILPGMCKGGADGAGLTGGLPSMRNGEADGTDLADGAALSDAEKAKIKEGTPDAEGSYVVIPDRKRAIEYAIDIAGEKDAVLIAGKGHEDYQIIGTKKIHFDDREVVQEALKNKCSQGAEKKVQEALKNKSSQKSS